MKRQAAVAGHFYRGRSDELQDQVKGFVQDTKDKDKVFGLVSPHAGLIYSGRVAGATYSRVSMPGNIILVGPNHTGMGERFALMSSGKWEIPTHTFDIDEDMANMLLKHSVFLKDDPIAHYYEHSLEVQLPFIAHFLASTPSADVKIVPITMLHASLQECNQVGITIARVIQMARSAGLVTDVVIVASSDMSHYVTEEQARYKDNLALEKILAMDPEGLYEVVHNENISMCGAMPVTVMLYACMELGATRAELVKYETSAETSGDYSHVVGYAGVLIK
ncbi:Mediator of ErbB2-driven cell motility (Memo)-like domain protein [Candidatus Magnetobacterium bavaricum]|uniref:MEMO1 family protein MBAV_005308 n=1 Tax=Candidatus Magnetobacterium bavaricum TaxID=29290 RepID=A0A0F3GKS9_9BACT|nr:Mediator of ErbB2-driven cell motility (Memo)-like domain protein [Candidatus Magnetobacterium bavaricum]